MDVRRLIQMSLVATAVALPTAAFAQGGRDTARKGTPPASTMKPRATTPAQPAQPAQPAAGAKPAAPAQPSGRMASTAYSADSSAATTAKCKDGQYYSGKRRGACSRHGGVGTWFSTTAAGTKGGMSRHSDPKKKG